MALEIDPQAINQLVADAVLKSALGDAVKKAVDDAIKKLSQSWDNPLETVVRNEVAAMAREVLRDDHGPAIRERVKAALTKKLSDEFIDRVCEAAASKYN
jgi:hypothetical protein